MWACCGLFGRRHGRHKDSEAGPSERTPLIHSDPEADALPFVPQIQPRALDDKALQEYHARIDRIIAEAADKFISVNNAPSLGYRKARSATTASSSSGRRSIEKSARQAKKTVDKPSGRDTIWRAEAPHHAHGAPGGSVYSLQKVTPNKGKGKAKETEAPGLHDTAEADDEQDKYGTVATYKTAQASLAEGSSENDNEGESEDDDLESGQATPTTLDRSMTEDSEEGGHDATIGKKGSKTGAGRRAVQDIWSDPTRTGKRRHQQSQVESRLQEKLALPSDEFAKLLTQ